MGDASNVCPSTAVVDFCSDVCEAARISIGISRETSAVMVTGVLAAPKKSQQTQLLNTNFKHFMIQMQIEYSPSEFKTFRMLGIEFFFFDKSIAALSTPPLNTELKI